MTSALLAAFHYLALGLGIGAAYERGKRLALLQTNSELQKSELNKVFFYDNIYGIAALLWLTTGLLRAFAGFEKGTAWYLANPLFHLKMGLFALVFFLELLPMTTFIKWRIIVRKQTLDFAKYPIRKMVWLNNAELILLLIIPFIASLMARGIFIG